MKIIFYSSNLDIIDEWILRHGIKDSLSFSEEKTLHESLSLIKEYILICDYDSVSHSINKMIATDNLPKNCVILESVPEIITGKMLISHGVKAYGNSRMLRIHYEQMIESVASSKVWTYPELTIALMQNMKKDILNEESTKLIQKRLTPKEQELIYCILDGLTNDATAHKLGITVRTVKAHISSIFSKLHVNDRLALVLLLK